MTPPRPERPCGLINFQKVLSAVNEHGEDGGPSASFADGNFSDSGYSLPRCKD